MGNSTSTRTHTHIKPAPVLTGVGTGGYGYGYLRVTRVWEPAWVGMAGLPQRRPGAVLLLPISTPLAVAHGGGWGCYCCGGSSGRGTIYCVGGAWLLAPGPPCEQVLTVVGDGCRSAVSLLFPPLQ